MPTRMPPIAFLFVVLAGASSSQQQGTSYTPDRRTAASPTSGQRAQGEVDLDNAAVSLAAAANGIDAAWAGFKSQCLRGFTAARVTSGREWYLLSQGQILTPTDYSCRALHTDLTNRTQGFMQQLETVEDAARRADVLPVRVRETFDRHRLR